MSRRGGDEDRGGSQLSAADRSARSVFVGNISYEATKEMVTQVFSKVGPVVHFRLVHDRDTGRPKGYGFCEYADQQTADSAIRNLNGFELFGRQLRVDSAAGGDRNAEEVQQLQLTLAGQHEESPYGPEPPEGKAPEAISRNVASLPPERMFELMKQMKQCVHSNPNEARNMLMSNPQLAYALLQVEGIGRRMRWLQAQVVMRIVDPQVAISMLHRDTSANVEPFHLQVPQFPNAGLAGPAGMMGPPGASHGYPQQLGAMGQQHMGPPGMMMTGQGHSSAAMENAAISSEEEQNAKLLIQVLQLNDEQIAMLPPEDRQKVLELRNQLRAVQ